LKTFHVGFASSFLLFTSFIHLFYSHNRTGNGNEMQFLITSFIWAVFISLLGRWHCKYGENVVVCAQGILLGTGIQVQDTFD